jgi:hypothetical protein
VAGLNNDERKDFKSLQDDWTKHAKMSDFADIQAKALVMSQMILGKLGYGASVEGRSSRRSAFACSNVEMPCALALEAHASKSIDILKAKIRRRLI